MTSAEDMTSAAEELLLAEEEKDTAAAATKAAKRRSKKLRQRAAAAERVRAEAEAEAAAKEEALLADAADEDALAVSRREQAALEQLLIESRWQLLELQEQEQALLARLAKRAEGACFTDKMRRHAVAQGLQLPAATRIPTALSLNFSNRSVLCDAVQLEKCTTFRDSQPEVMLQIVQTLMPGALKYAQPHQHAQLRRLVKDTLTSSNAGNYYSLEATAARLRGLDFEQCCTRCAHMTTFSQICGPL